MQRIALGLIVGLVFVGALVYGTLQETGVECEVCVDFAGMRTCRSAIAANREGAIRTAVKNVCAVVSDGVTQGLECDRSPRAVRCKE